MRCVFGELIGHIIEAYVDDIMVKKCIFGAPRGMLLGFVLAVDFGTPSYEFIANICMYLIF
jgi:hypothetical protein